MLLSSPIVRRGTGGRVTWELATGTREKGEGKKGS